MGLAGGARGVERPAHEGAADPPAAKLRLHRERAEQERPAARFPDRDRRLLHAADKPAVHPRRERKARAGPVAGAEAVRGFVPAVLPEHPVEQRFDSGQVGGFKRKNLERAHGRTAPGRTGRRRCRPEPCPAGSAASSSEPANHEPETNPAGRSRQAPARPSYSCHMGSFMPARNALWAASSSGVGA